MSTAQTVLNLERAELGYAENPFGSNRTKYAAEAGHANGYAWCATFQVAMFRAAGIKLGNESAYTPSLYNSLPHISGPRVGALVFFAFDGPGRICHVGLVESVRPDGRFVTIEGNTDEAGGRTGGKVMRKVRSNYNTYFAMPHYDSTSGGSASPAGHRNCIPLQRALRTTPDNVWGGGTDKNADALRAAVHGQFPAGVKFAQQVVGAAQDGVWGNDSKAKLSATVKAVQDALHAMGFDPGKSDGVWGSKSEAAYQAARKACHI